MALRCSIEDEVIKIFEAVNVSVGGERLSKIQIQAVHRIEKAQEKTVAKFVNHRFASEALYASKNLKDNSPYNNPIYLNRSLCREFAYLNFLVRKAAKGKRVARWKVKKGITLVKISKNDPKFHEITHHIVLIDLGIYDVIPEETPL